MITIRDNPAVASPLWTELADELDRWGEKGRIATLWWRDDDAVVPSQRLERLLAMAGEVPLALAVIPAFANEALAAYIVPSAGSRLRVLQHGWRHVDHASGGKKSEFPRSRTGVETAADLAEGRTRLVSLFGDRALAVLAPPWNRFDDSFLPLLAANGIRGISRVRARALTWPAPGVFEANVHVDLIAWRGDKGFVGEPAALGELVGHLRARRCGAVGPDEPTGILTHHLVQDEATGDFLGRLLEMTCDHPAARWLDVGEVFAPAFAVMRPTRQA
jgi:hypothetical protein